MLLIEFRASYMEINEEFISQDFTIFRIDL
jgi:hypothetical protein